MLFGEMLRRFRFDMWRRSPKECLQYGGKLLTPSGRTELRHLMHMPQPPNAAPMKYQEPMPLMVAPPLREVPGQRRVSLLLPWLHTDSMSGGPNTAILLALRLADVAKIPIRFVSTDLPCGDVDALWQHFLQLTE